MKIEEIMNFGRSVKVERDHLEGCSHGQVKNVNFLKMRGVILQIKELIT